MDAMARRADERVLDDGQVVKGIWLGRIRCMWSVKAAAERKHCIHTLHAGEEQAGADDGRRDALKELHNTASGVQL